MSTQTEAARLAESLEEVHCGHANEGPTTFSEAAAELRRLEAECERLKRDAERWNWWMSDAPKDIQTYLFGCRDKWTTERWNAWADQAIAALKETQ